MNLTTDWRVGFVDGEGCFTISINANKETSLGYQVQLEFVVTQSREDLQVLEGCKAFFQCGVIQKGKDPKTVAYYRVRALQEHAEIIVPFFEKHALKTRKRQDFLIYRDAVFLLQKLRLSKEPRNRETLRECCELAKKANRRKDPKASERLDNLLSQLQSQT